MPFRLLGAHGQGMTFAPLFGAHGQGMTFAPLLGAHGQGMTFAPLLGAHGQGMTFAPLLGAHGHDAAPFWSRWFLQELLAPFNKHIRSLVLRIQPSSLLEQLNSL